MNAEYDRVEWSEQYLWRGLCDVAILRGAKLIVSRDHDAMRFKSVERWLWWIDGGKSRVWRALYPPHQGHLGDAETREAARRGAYDRLMRDVEQVQAELGLS